MRAAAATPAIVGGAWGWLLAVAFAAAVLYAPLAADLVDEWTRFPNLSHGFAIPLIAAYLLWTRRERVLDVRPAPALSGLPVLVLGLAALVVGVRGEEPFIARASLPVTLLGATLFLGGGRLLRETWIPIAYLTFMVPLPWGTLSLLSYRSRLFDAAASATALRWLGIPVYRDGVMLYLPNIRLEVADECSSIPALAALLALGAAYAHLTRRPLGLKVLLLAATLPLGIVSNIVRITTTSAAVYHIGPWTLDTLYHQFNGTVNFLVTLALLLALDHGLVRLWRRSPS